VEINGNKHTNFKIEELRKVEKEKKNKLRG
jgi:hypothetical protein